MDKERKIVQPSGPPPTPSEEWLPQHSQDRLDRWRNATDAERGQALANLLKLAS